MQRNYIFPGRCAPLTYCDWLRGRPRKTNVFTVHAMFGIMCTEQGTPIGL